MHPAYAKVAENKGMTPAIMCYESIYPVQRPSLPGISSQESIMPISINAKANQRRRIEKLYESPPNSPSVELTGISSSERVSQREKYIDLVDENYRGCESRVRFYNYETKKDVYIITKNPAWNDREHQNPFHMDPHPHFTCGGKYVCHTTTVDGHIDVAITPVDQLIEMTK